MAYSHPQYKYQKPTIINLAFGVPKYINLTENKHLLIKNEQFKVQDEHYYLKGIQYRVVWVQQDDVVRLKKEMI